MTEVSLENVISKEDLDRLRTQEERRADASKAEVDALQLLKERIKKGHTTGDLVTDVSILYFNGDKNHEDKLRNLNNNLEKNKGGLVLVETTYAIKISDEPQGCFGGGLEYSYIKKIGR